MGHTDIYYRVGRGTSPRSLCSSRGLDGGRKCVSVNQIESRSIHKVASASWGKPGGEADGSEMSRVWPVQRLDGSVCWQWDQ